MRIAPLDFLRRSFGYKYPRLGPVANNLFFKLAPRYLDTELFPGIRAILDSRDSTQRATYWQGDRFEFPTAKILAQWASEGASCFFDIGANYGFFSYWLLSRSKTISVHSFEPNPKTFKLIERIKDSNQLNNLHPYCMGLADVDDRLHLHPGNEDSGHSTFGDHPALNNQDPVSVPVAPFDTWRERLGLALPQGTGWIAKIDVEGFELRVLKGMKQALLARAFIGLSIEINEFTLNFTGAKPRDIFDWMDDCGYVPMAPTDSNTRDGNAFFVPTAVPRPAFR